MYIMNIKVFLDNTLIFIINNIYLKKQKDTLIMECLYLYLNNKIVKIYKLKYIQKNERKCLNNLYKMISNSKIE